jgi:hypothetical protein
LDWGYLNLNSVRKECIFNEDDGIHNPYIALYILGKIWDDRFNTSMKVISDFYKPIYPANSYSLLAIHDKNTWIFKDKSYCDEVVTNNYDDFRRGKEWNNHSYSDEIKEEQVKDTE